MSSPHKSSHLAVAMSAATVLLAACSDAGMEAAYHVGENPASLSDWGVFDVSSGRLELSDGVVPYDLNTPLFTDYAHKLRTIWMPAGAAPAAYRSGDYPD